MNKEESQIQTFYKSQNVFLTGGTGFLGKIFIEKLLRSTEIATLYILIREKKGKNALSRIEELFEDVVSIFCKRKNPTSPFIITNMYVISFARILVTS